MTEKTENEPELEPQADATAEEEAQDDLPANEVIIEQAGTLRKKVTIEVARERIDAKFGELFGELGSTAQVPGFRIGRAPRRLIEKRFGREVGQDVRNALIGEALGDALERQDLNVIGEPDIDLEAIELPDEGKLSFSFEVEVSPEFELPDYKGVEIKRPVVEITDEHVDGAIRERLEAAGTIRPVDAPAGEGDFVAAGVSISGEGIDFADQNVELRVAPAQIAGVLLEDLAETLTGKRSGDTCSLTTTVSGAHPQEDWRGKEVTVTFEIKEVKVLEPAKLDDAFAERAGYDSVADMRDAMRDQFKSEVLMQRGRLMRDQVRRFLLDNTTLEVPESMTGRHARQLLRRRVIDLTIRGASRERIEQNMQELEAATSEQAVTELKLRFILTKVAEAEEVEIEEEEVNSTIARIAASYRRRPERLRQEMQNDGRLEEITAAMREDKAIDKILESARITDVGDAEDKGQGEEEPKKSARKSKARKGKTPAKSAEETNERKTDQ